MTFVYIFRKIHFTNHDSFLFLHSKHFVCKEQICLCGVNYIYPSLTSFISTETQIMHDTKIFQRADVDTCPSSLTVWLPSCGDRNSVYNTEYITALFFCLGKHLFPARMGKVRLNMFYPRRTYIYLRDITFYARLANSYNSNLYSNLYQAR